ncbi:MAG: hypothetical protein J5965_04520 [Aeriscardovia sp.]|nr:hypothetical protein [Aeriscardovia sp.]
MTTQITKRIMFVSLALFQCMIALAQLGDPREKLSITASVDGATNTDYRRESEDGQLMENGRLRQGVNARLQIGLKLLSSQHFSLSFNPFYDFSTRSLKPDDGSRQPQLPIPDVHHHYGGGFTGTYNTQWLGKPFTVFATVTGHFSQYGYENFSSMTGAIFAITRNRTTYLSLGAICLIGTSVSWPIYPLIIYNHRFNDRWSINCMETNNYLYYQVTPKLRCALGMELVTNKQFLRPDKPDLPRKMEISELSERFGVFADLQATKELSFNFGLGATVPFYSRLRESGYNKTYMRMYDHVKPFLKLQMKYSIK